MLSAVPQPLTPERPEPSGRPWTYHLVLWAALGIAFSPVLSDLVTHVVATPWTWYTALFPLLFAIRIVRETNKSVAKRDGLVWLGIGLVLAILAAFTGMARVGRAGFVLGAIGLSRRFALADMRNVIFLAGCIPIPAALMKLVAPALPKLMLTLAGVVHGPAADLPIYNNVARIDPTAFALDRFDSGLALVPLLAGLAWYTSCEFRDRLPRAIARIAAWSLLAIPVQASTTILALHFSASQPSLARHLMTHTGWIAISIVALVWVELRRHRNIRT